jgi:hypothetical protein
VGSGDVNGDSRIDLIISSPYANSNTGRLFIFYNDGNMPTTGATADVIINGESTGYLGNSFVVGDFNNDTRLDILTEGSSKLYTFYNDGSNDFGTATCTGSAPTICSAINADVIISGATGLGYFVTKGDLNSDNIDDLIVSGTKAVYVFYNDGSLPSSVLSADLTIYGEANATQFGVSMVAGDFNNDNVRDLLVGDNYYNSNQGKVFVFNMSYRNPQNSVNFNADTVELNAKSVEFLN